MTDHDQNFDLLRQTLNHVEQQLPVSELTVEGIQQLALDLSRFADATNEAGRDELYQGAEWMVRVLESALQDMDACHSDNPESTEEQRLRTQEMVQHVCDQIPVVRDVLDCPDETGHDKIQQFIDAGEQRWFNADDPYQEFDEHWSGDEADSQDDLTDISESQIELLLAAVQPSSDDESPTDSEPVAASSFTDTFADTQNDHDDQEAMNNLAADRELLEAWSDDASRCLASMEQSALTLESNPADFEPVRQFCRELHTLKGASATVGLSGLASFCHELESSLEQAFGGDATELETESLFAAVDHVRSQIQQIQNLAEQAAVPRQGTGPESFPASKPTAPPADFSATEFRNGGGDDASVRIRAAQLDRLMDMLAELVVLRNRRESHVAEFNHFNEELIHCGTRLNLTEEKLQFEYQHDLNNPVSPTVSESSRTMFEVGKDITAVSEGLRELQKPLSHDNAAISGFIRNFRQELMQLRRVPVSGLFNRLRRAARDAAKSESKQVQIKFKGETAGLEQEIQERLFESLLHVVRNAVSHGIETPEAREKSGKSSTGTLTLSAFSSAQTMVIEVRDDGQGLDYDAVLKRGIEKGLIVPGQNPTRDEIAALIFQPGFSTRTEATEVSGRGVGMEIVSRTIEQLRGRIEIESTVGHGTSMRLMIPLRTGIEHVMVFKCNGHRFALPMHSVTAAKTHSSMVENLVRLFGTPADQAKCTDVLLLKTGHDGIDTDSSFANENNFALGVDELIGPEEVVVRSLPNLLKPHPLFCGVTLSGTGELVLLLDSHRMVEFFEDTNGETPSDTCDTLQSDLAHERKRALIVDDSLTARRTLAQILHQLDFVTVEAGDGIEAIERLHREPFDVIFTDLDMPRLGGFELIRDIQSGHYCEAPVVVVSGRAAENFRSQSLALGAVEFLNKPVSRESIALLVDNLVAVS